MIIEKYTITTIKEVTELDETLRGDGGFGSTGIKRTLAELESELKK